MPETTRPEDPALIGEEVGALEAPAKELRAVHVEYDRSDSQLQILQKLTARGFVIKSAGSAEAKEEGRYRMTIVLSDCDDTRLRQAVQQINSIVTVVDAAEIPVKNVMQHVQVRTTSQLGDETRKGLRKIGAHFDERVEMPAMSTHGMARVTRDLSRSNVKLMRAKTEKVEGDPKQVSVTLKIRDMRADVRQSLTERGGVVGDIVKIQYTADPVHVDAFVASLERRGIEIDELLIDPPTVSSTKILQRLNDAEAARIAALEAELEDLPVE